MRPEEDPAVQQDGASHQVLKKRQRLVPVMLGFIIAIGVVAFGAYLVIGYLAVSNA